jgi:hypothetical protein
LNVFLVGEYLKKKTGNKCFIPRHLMDWFRRQPEVVAVTTNSLDKLFGRAASINRFLQLKRTKSVRFAEEKYFELVTFLSVTNTAAEDGSSILNETRDAPGSDALLQQLKKLGLDEVEAQFNRVFAGQFVQVFGKKRRPRGVAIIDVHEQATHTKQKRISLDIRGGKHKNGTDFFFHFVTIQFLAKGEVVTMGVRLHRRGEALRDVVAQLVRLVLRYADIELLLLDRGFRDVELINELEYLGVPILMPAFSDERTRKALAAMQWHRRRWWFRNARCEYADVTLLKAALPDGTAVGFYTTMRCTWWRPPQYFLDAYKRRWTIETGYRVQNEFLAKTTSIVGAVRLFYFSYAVALHNLWLRLRSSIMTVRFTVKRMKCALISWFLGLEDERS